MFSHKSRFSPRRKSKINFEWKNSREKRLIKFEMNIMGGDAMKFFCV